MTAVASTDAPAFYDADELAKLLRMSPRSVERAAKLGNLPPGLKATTQAKRLWPAAQINDWMKQGCPPFNAKGGAK